MNPLASSYRQLKQFFRHCTNAFSARAGLLTGYYRRARGSRIIVYHGVCEKRPLRFNTLFVTRKTLERHLRYYRKYCNLVSLDDYYQQRFDPGKFNICISFDDGFAGACRHALPLLEKYQVPAAFFITAIRDAGEDILWNDLLALGYSYGPQTIRAGETPFRKQKNKYREPKTGISLNDHLRTRSFKEKKACLGILDQHTAFKKDPSLRDYWLQMDIDEIRKLSSSPLITVGSHGYYHNDLAHDDEPTLVAELKNSKRFLESVTGTQVCSLAFPYGSYSQRVIGHAKQAGYVQLLATGFLSDSDQHEPMLRERMGINPFIGTLAQLRAIIKGSYA